MDRFRLEGSQRGSSPSSSVSSSITHLSVILYLHLSSLLFKLWLYNPSDPNFPFPLASTILQIPISKTNSVQDTLLWKYSKNGKYQVKKAYDFLARDHLVHPRHDQPQMGSWSRIWKVKVPLKVNNFIWKLMHDRLPTLLNLNIRGISTSNIYPLCNEGNCNSPLFTLSFC